MVGVIVKRNTYGGEEYVRNACRYVTNPSKAIAVYGCGVDYTSAENCYKNMMAVKSYFRNTSGNPLLHIIVSYDENVKDIKTACEMSKKCAGYFDFKYQNIFCTHEKEHGNSKFHTHILVNSVAYTDGKLINSWVGNMNDFCDHVEMVTGRRTRLYIKNGAGEFKELI